MKNPIPRISPSQVKIFQQKIANLILCCVSVRIKNELKIFFFISGVEKEHLEMKIRGNTLSVETVLR